MNSTQNFITQSKLIGILSIQFYGVIIAPRSKLHKDVTIKKKFLDEFGLKNMVKNNFPEKDKTHGKLIQ